MVAATQAEVGDEGKRFGTAPGAGSESATEAGAGGLTSTWGRHRRRARPVVLVLAAILVGGLASHAWIVTRDATARAQAELRDTRAQAGQAQAGLDAANVRLAAVRATLAGEAWTLDQRQDQQAAAQAQLDELEAMLTEVQAQLEAEFADLAAGANQLDALERCLIGVAGALNQVSVGDTNGVAATLRGIDGDCAQAGVVP